MKSKILILLALAFVSNSIIAQSHVQWPDSMISKDFGQMEIQFEQYFQQNPGSKSEKHFRRWQFWAERHLDGSGDLVSVAVKNQEAYTDYLNNSSGGQGINGMMGLSNTGQWTEVGPWSWTNIPDPYPSTSQGGWNPGNGRMNEITFHPTNANIIFAGSAAGGLWKSVNGGSSWSSLTDGMSNLGVSGIAIDPTDPDIIYLLTGDGEGFLPEMKTIGVLKSTNGGQSWFSTGLSWDVSELVRPYELRMHPTNPDILLATTSEGLYKTSDGALSWTEVRDGYFFDIEYAPGNGSIWYACTNDTIFKSINTGTSWFPVADESLFGTPNLDRIELAVTPANNQYVYAVVGNDTSFVGLFRSSNYGSAGSWVMQSGQALGSPNVLAGDTGGNNNSTQAFYDLSLAVSPSNLFEVYVGGINIWKSTNGGNSWTINTHWRHDWSLYNYVHADIHELVFNGSNLYVGCDGGVFRTQNGGSSWTDLSSGLRVMQLYHIGVDQNSSNVVFGGTQDNGCNRFNGTTSVRQVRGADGFENLVDPSNSSIVYSCTQRGQVYRSSDGGTTYSFLGTNTGGLFDFPLVINPRTNQIFRGVYGVTRNPGTGTSGFSMLGGTSIAQSGGRYHCRDLSHSSSSDTLISLDYLERVYMCPNSDTALFAIQWFEVTNNLPSMIINGPGDTSFLNTSSIYMNPTNSKEMWVTYSGYVDGVKVFKTTNGGNNWFNYSGSLPNVPIHDVYYQSGTDGGVYIGSDIGIFYRDNSLSDWHFFSLGLPVVPVLELEINYSQGELYAATHGRGLWKSDLYGACNAAYVLTAANDPNPGYSGQQVYQASVYINSERTVEGGVGTNVYYQAGDRVDLLEDFVVEAGNSFHAKIGPCSTITGPSLTPGTPAGLSGYFAGPMPGLGD